MSIELPNPMQQNIIEGLSQDYQSSLASKQPEALNFLGNRMIDALGSMDDNTKSFVESEIIDYINNFTSIEEEQPINAIYTKQNAEAEGLALTPKIKK